ncbi:winged helix DNA-binding domain-containing protein [Catellatospora sichuanensis]|uniref:winged helix DNA-binding domain-containing protein n=1 Tax=Catellatospora sichuanensis TaxID=1969805 RepID=UPI001181CDB7|nr:winged helix DNA-binding domain-containing protein [Catellatospora sichuanensis]
MVAAAARNTRVTLSARQLNRATLDRQLLLRREPLNVAGAVRRIVALQAQEPASPYLALWARIADFDPADLAAALTDQTLVKATLMRLTLHIVAAVDYPIFHTAMLPNLRGPRLGDRRFTSSGLSIPDTDALLPHLAEFASRPRTSAEVEQLLTARLGQRTKGVWWALRTYAPLHHVPVGGPWSFGSPSTYIAAPATPGARNWSEDVQRLVLRYLEAFGPATMQDIAQFTIIKRSIVQNALTELGDTIQALTGPENATLFDVHEGRHPAEDTPAPPRLLPMWDSIMLAYADRSRIIPPQHRAAVLRRNGDVLPTLLVDGYVAGVWRPVAEGIEATAFRQLDDETWQGLESEAARLQSLLADRDPAVYRRYRHWWSKGLPSADVRLLAN